MPHRSTEVAREAFSRGYSPVAILAGAKRPVEAGFQKRRWTSEEEVVEAFDRWAEQGADNIGVVLGELSGGLVDIDLDDNKAARLRDDFLPPTEMKSGRLKRRLTHFWYEVTEDLPATRQYKDPTGHVLVELRSTGVQTVLPPSVHPDDDTYVWEGPEFGGEVGPARVNGKYLGMQVALLALTTLLINAWPKRGGRHEAYLALTGALLRSGPDEVHGWWERNVGTLIGGIAVGTNDEDGADARVKESVGTTLTKLREGGRVFGWPKLAELIGDDTADLARRWSADIVTMAGYVGTPMTRLDGNAGAGPAATSPQAPPGPAPAPVLAGDVDDVDAEPEGGQEESIPAVSAIDADPMSARVSSWASVDLVPYIEERVVAPTPTVLMRTDGHALFYAGRVNSIFGKSESAKSWIAVGACVQELIKGERVLYIDFEDFPEGIVDRLKRLGAPLDDLRLRFRYVRPESPLAAMQRNRFGDQSSSSGRADEEVFRALLDTFDPTLVIVDGMTDLYGIHGLDTNDAAGTSVVTTWLKSITRNGRSTVIVIDHTTKDGGPGSSPTGSHHKIAMIQGVALRVDVVQRPMQDAHGWSDLVVFKDRLGSVRKISTKLGNEQRAGRFHLDSTTPGVSRFWIDPSDSNEVTHVISPQQQEVIDRIATRQREEDDVIDAFQGDLDRQMTSEEIRDATGLSAAGMPKVLARLLKDGRISKDGKARGTRYWLTEPMFADPEDDDL